MSYHKLIAETKLEESIFRKGQCPVLAFYDPRVKINVLCFYLFLISKIAPMNQNIRFKNLDKQEGGGLSGPLLARLRVSARL